MAATEGAYNWKQLKQTEEHNDELSALDHSAPNELTGIEITNTHNFHQHKNLICRFKINNTCSFSLKNL